MSEHEEETRRLLEINAKKNTTCLKCSRKVGVIYLWDKKIFCSHICVRLYQEEEFDKLSDTKILEKVAAQIYCSQFYIFIQARGQKAKQALASKQLVMQWNEYSKTRILPLFVRLYCERILAGDERRNP